jgi:hypothetical protein
MFEGEAKSLYGTVPYRTYVGILVLVEFYTDMTAQHQNTAQHGTAQDMDRQVWTDMVILVSPTGLHRSVVVSYLTWNYLPLVN